MIGIAVALPEELKTLTRQRLNPGEITISDEIIVILAGMGAENAKKAAQTLLHNNVDRLVSWGCAAGLIPSLKPGDLVLTSNCMTAQGQRITVTSEWAARLCDDLAKDLDAKSGLIAESKTLVDSSVAKANLAQATGAIALDMESTAIAEIAFAKGVPFVAIRAIADPSSLALPKVLNQAMMNGELNKIKLISLLLKQPSQIVSLVRLAFCFRAAQKTLFRVAKKINTFTEYTLPGC